MKLLDLFAGIGGFSLAAHWMGWETVAFCEQNKFCQQVLRKNFGQGITIHDDIRELDGTQYRGTADIVCGGFPCQPYSLAGKRKGTDDDRHLWPEMLRVITEVQPSFVVGENVFGLVNWSGGLVFEQVQADLEAAGYEVWAGILPAAGVGAPHRRNRVWFVANAVNDGNLRRPRTDASSCGEERLSERHEIQRATESVGVRDSTNADAPGLSGRIQRQQPSVSSPTTAFSRGQSPRTPATRYGWEEFPTQPAVCGRDDGIPIELDALRRGVNDKSSNQKSESERSVTEWKVLRKVWELQELAATSPGLYEDRLFDSLPELPQRNSRSGWLVGQRLQEDQGLRNLWEAFYAEPFDKAQDLQQRVLERIGEIERSKKMASRQRTDRIKALGNSIVPQVAYEIFRAIEAAENK